MSIEQELLANDIWMVRVSDRLDHLLASSLEQTLHGLLREGHVQLVLDCSQTPYINSAGLRVLVGAWRIAREQGGDLVLCCLNGRLQTIFMMVGFHKIFTIYDTPQAAQTAFDAEP